MLRVMEEDSQLTSLNEMFVNVLPSLPTNIENSIYYTKIKSLLHPEIFNFCKEYTELKNDLNFFRMSVGEVMSEYEIREYLEALKTKYNGNDNKIALDYHIEVTRVDYGVPVFCMVRRGSEIRMKKFVFRFRKTDQQGLSGLSLSQIPVEEPITKNIFKNISGGDN